MPKKNIIVLVVMVAVLIAVSYLTLVSREEVKTIEVTETAPPELNSPNIKDTGKVWLELIEDAQSTIDIEAYFLGAAFAPFILDNIYDALIEAADNREVEVRILISSGGPTDYEVANELRRQESIEILSWSGDGALHSKYMIVDGEIVSVGSANLSYPAMATHGNRNREINLTLRGEEIAETYTCIFETGWTEAGGESRGAEYSWDEDWLIPVADGTGDPQVASTIDALKELFELAEDRVYIYMYISAPPDELVDVMESALERGVTIEVLVDTESEREYQGALAQLAGLEGVNVSVIDLPAAAHAKLVIADDRWAYVGSSNIHFSWMYEGREVGALVNSEEIVADLLDLFVTDWGSVYTRRF